MLGAVEQQRSGNAALWYDVGLVMKLGVCVTLTALAPGVLSCASGSVPASTQLTPSTLVEMEPAEPVPVAASSAVPVENMLPTDFKVYVQGDTVINHAEEGFEEKTLPTVNVFTGSAGCYVACYSRDAEKGVYGVGGGIFVNGQVRVEGAYKGRTWLPAGYETADISAEQSFKELCGKHVASCGAKCWAGGDTGGWFGAP